MRKQDREMFSGEWKFTVQKRSNYHDGQHWRHEWRIERHRDEGNLTATMRVCDFFGNRPLALVFVAALNSVAGMKRTITNLRRSNATFREANAETLANYHVAASRLVVERENTEAVFLELRKRAEEFDKRKDEFTQELAAKVRMIDERDARIVAMSATNLGLVRDNQLLTKRVAEAEALVGRIVIKRDRRVRP